MPNSNELVSMLRAVIQEELKPFHQELQQVNTRLTTLETGQQELKKGQAAIEAAVNDLRAINRRTHKEVFGQLNAIWDDIKLLSSQGKKAIR